MNVVECLRSTTFMDLQTDCERAGAWFFRYRSFLPLLMLPLICGAFKDFHYYGESHVVHEIWIAFCLGISLMGMAIRAAVGGFAPKGTSGRNTKHQVADRLNTSGAYSIVRHPLYLGNYFIYIGLTMALHSAWLTLITMALFALYYERIMMAEESFLRKKFGDDFRAWAAETPAFIPRLSRWRNPDLPFSWRSVLRREYTTLFGILTAFVVVEILGDSLAEHRFRLDWPWLVLFLGGLLTYITLRTLKRRTAVLDCIGR